MARLRIRRGSRPGRSLAPTGARLCALRTHLLPATDLHALSLLTRPFWTSRPCLLTASGIQFIKDKVLVSYPSQPDWVEFAKGEGSLVLSTDHPRGSGWTHAVGPGGLGRVLPVRASVPPL